MRERGRGRIINVSSLGGLYTPPFLGVYSSTKYAVESLSDALRIELFAPRGARVHHRARRQRDELDGPLDARGP
jgi:short-subunit dehydrogenase